MKFSRNMKHVFIFTMIILFKHVIAEPLDSVIKIKVPNGQELVILQISDSHLSGMAPSDIFMAYGKRMRDAYAPGEAKANFLSILAQATKEKADLIVLSGDIFNYPSADEVSFVKTNLEKTGIPFMYVNGNHDWHFESEEGTLEELRSKWSTSTLSLMFQDRNYKGYSLIVRGYRILMLDDSTWQFDAAQVKIVEEALAAPEPIIVVVHIPLFIEGNIDSPLLSCGNPLWGFKTDTGYLLEKREQFPESGNLPTTMAVMRMINESRKVVAVLSGHIHKPRIELLNINFKQYSTPASVLGGYQIIRVSGNIQE